MKFFAHYSQKKEKGQLSVFLAICVLCIITLLAFIINVGLYVKARINLQNAVDSAAYAGAATQARMLTNIAYLNWELHNTYKEWMMKYYVLGNISMSHTRPGGYRYPTDDRMIFRQRKLLGTAVASPEGFDRYNVPSICIHFGSDNNICEIAKVPGIPRFESVGIPGVSEKQEEFLNEISKAKSEDCSKRSILNWGVAALWAYGTGNSNALKDMPAVASNRMGAWPQALELGMRIRNLEVMVNRPPVKNGICYNDCDQNPNDLSTEYGDLPFNERPVKAFLSAYKNLGGESGKPEGIIKDTFKLYELAPTPFTAPANSLSALLINQDKKYQNGTPFLDKNYLDLQAIPLNLVTFFTSFVTADGKAAGVTADGSCQASKTALPVPGYIFGFAKNPDVVTYYAVKGEAKYRGLLNPFSDNLITIKAYAAALPFGGRIGPRFFDITSDSVRPRTGSRALSGPFVSGIESPDSSSSQKYIPGMPIPSNKQFWVTTHDDSIGGVPDSGNTIKFGIPNMFYEISETDLSSHKEHFTGRGLEILTLATSATHGEVELYSSGEKMGLYSRKQFEQLHNLLPRIQQSISAIQIDYALDKIRGPTYFDANSYMIPSVEASEYPATGQTESFGITGAIKRDEQNYRGVYLYKLYAPLLAPGLNYETVQDIQDTAKRYLLGSSNAVEAFIKALKEVADGMNDPSIGNVGDAPKSIYQDGDMDPAGCKKSSLSQKFDHFLSGKKDTSVCDIIPVHIAMRDHFQKEATSGDSNFKTYFQTTYFYPQNWSPLDLMTAYFPSSRQGANDEVDSANNPHPFGFNTGNGSSAPASKRNFYSVKFVSLSRLLSDTPDSLSIHRKIFYEAGTAGAGEMQDFGIMSSFANGLSKQELSEFGNDLFF